jgi:hypothetical protein
MGFMGFSLSKSLEEAVVKLVNAKDWDQEQATPIPNSPGFVLVKQGSQAFHERMAAKGIFMIPVQLGEKSCGAEVPLLCYVCTK